jgi:carbon starvation protein CstA
MEQFLLLEMVEQGDYFAINTPPDKFATLGLSMDHLPELQHAIGERLEGRAGGAGVDADGIHAGSLAPRGAGAAAGGVRWR